MENKSIFNRLSERGPLQFISRSIRNKLLVSMLLLALIPLVALGVIAYLTASNSLEQKALSQMESIDALSSGEITTWLADRRGDILFARNLVVVKGSPGVNEGLPVLVQYKNDKSNPAYVNAFERANSVLTAFKDNVAGSAYFDVMLVDLTGEVLFSLKPESLGTNETGSLEFKSGLQDVYFSDIAYNQVDKLLNQRLVAPVLDDGGQTVGVIFLEISLEKLGTILNNRAGLGLTGETYVVGQDLLWRSNSRFAKDLGVETTLMDPDLKVDTFQAKEGLEGRHGVQLSTDYRNVHVLASWSPLVIQEPTALDPDGVKWVLLSEIDQDEVNAPVVQLAWITGGVVAVAAMLVILAAVFVSSGLTNQAKHITGLFSEIGIGEFEARAKVTSQDELGTMASSLNAMLDNTLTLIQSREERDSIQSSIMKLLEEVSGLATGDLTQEAEVTADMTGAIADAFNLMILELRRIISHVQDATLQVSSSANEIQTTAEHLAQGSKEQSQQIADTAAAIDEMAVSIQQVAENASLSAAVGEQATTNARKGTLMVQNTIDGMNRIREQVQETAKRIKRLGESSQEIGEIIQLIDDIADRTSILALNASIQAAMAGEAGRGFAVVAEEVERLAERSTEATKQIASLIKTIQSETNEAVAAMESTTREVVNGSQVADQAGQALTEIEGVSSRLSELIQSISMAAKQQARGSDALAKSMDQISLITQQTAAGTEQAAVSINSLAILADDLRGSVSTFKLPSNGHSRN